MDPSLLRILLETTVNSCTMSDSLTSIVLIVEGFSGGQSPMLEMHIGLQSIVDRYWSE